MDRHASVSRYARPLLEIVPVQVAAMRLAELRGIVLGSFRYAAQVTRDEGSIALKRPLTANR